MSAHLTLNHILPHEIDYLVCCYSIILYECISSPSLDRRFPEQELLSCSSLCPHSLEPRMGLQIKWTKEGRKVAPIYVLVTGAISIKSHAKVWSFSLVPNWQEDEEREGTSLNTPVLGQLSANKWIWALSVTWQSSVDITISSCWVSWRLETPRRKIRMTVGGKWRYMALDFSELRSRPRFRRWYINGQGPETVWTLTYNC